MENIVEFFVKIFVEKLRETDGVITTRPLPYGTKLHSAFRKRKKDYSKQKKIKIFM